MPHAFAPNADPVPPPGVDPAERMAVGRRRTLLQVAVLSALAPAPWLAVAAPSAHEPKPAIVPVHRVRFVRHTGQRTLTGELQGPRRIARDFVMHALAGETLHVTLGAPAPGLRFTVHGPGKGEPLFDSAHPAAPEWTGKLAAEGDYHVRVTLKPEARRDHHKHRFTLKLNLSAG